MTEEWCACFYDNPFDCVCGFKTPKEADKYSEGKGRCILTPVCSWMPRYFQRQQLRLRLSKQTKIRNPVDI